MGVPTMILGDAYAAVEGLNETRCALCCGRICVHQSGMKANLVGEAEAQPGQLAQGK